MLVSKGKRAGEREQESMRDGAVAREEGKKEREKKRESEGGKRKRGGGERN